MQRKYYLLCCFQLLECENARKLFFIAGIEDNHFSIFNNKSIEVLITCIRICMQIENDITNKKIKIDSYSDA